MYSKVACQLLMMKGYKVEESNEVELLRREVEDMKREREQIAKCYILEYQKSEYNSNKTYNNSNETYNNSNKTYNNSNEKYNNSVKIINSSFNKLIWLKIS